MVNRQTDVMSFSECLDVWWPLCEALWGLVEAIRALFQVTVVNFHCAAINYLWWALHISLESSLSSLLLNNCDRVRLHQDVSEIYYLCDNTSGPSLLVT